MYIIYYIFKVFIVSKQLWLFQQLPLKCFSLSPSFQIPKMLHFCHLPFTSKFPTDGFSCTWPCYRHSLTKSGVSGSWGTQITGKQGASVTWAAQCPCLPSTTVSAVTSCWGLCLSHTGLRALHCLGGKSAARVLKEKRVQNLPCSNPTLQQF